MDKTTIVAEIGINHMGDLGKAKALIEAAKEAGADLVKFQTYKTEKRTFCGSAIWNILKQCELNYDQFRELKEYSDSISIEFFSTPFDLEDLIFLVEELEVKRIKLSSFDITNTKFLKEANNYGKKHCCDVILSTGMSNMGEIWQATNHLANIDNLTILHCKSSYPLDPKDANLSAIRSLVKIFRHTYIEVGYSCHTKEIYTPAASVLVGAKMIEKHFMINETDQVIDAPVSLDKNKFKEMVELVRKNEEILGDGHLGLDKCEEAAKVFRRKS